jgi:sterol 3beta-glucosyltransferase
MKISILAIGSRGDVQPLVALGLGLQAYGHEVCIITHAEFEGVVHDSGLGFFSIPVSPRELLASEAGQAAVEGGNNPLRSLMNFSSLANKGILPIGAACLTAFQETDMVIYSPLGFYIAPHVAERLNVAAIGAYLQPFHRTSAFPSYVSPTPRHLGGFLNRLSYIASEALFWLPYRLVVNQLRKEQLNLSPIPLWVNQSRKWQQSSPVIYGFSPTVVPKPPEWGNNIEITGYWFLDRKGLWQPPTELADFLAAGPPPVYVGFGSMSTRKPKETTELVLQALSHTRQRGLLLTGWGGLNQVELPENIFIIENAPHDWLFSQMAAVIHHGGAGTTAAGLRAGVPTIIVPHFMDQFFWGQRVAELGVGPQPISRKQLSVERLTDAIAVAMTDEKIRRRAAEIGEIIRAEDGVARAVEAINSYHSADKH